MHTRTPWLRARVLICAYFIPDSVAFEVAKLMPGVYKAVNITTACLNFNDYQQKLANISLIA